MLRRLWLLTPALAFAVSACSDDSPTELDAGAPPDSGPSPDAGQLATGITIETLRLDFGGVVVTSTDSATLTLTNDNDAPVRVTVTEPMGGDADRFSRALDVAAEDGRFEVPAGGTVTVTVEVSPSELGPIGTNLLVESCSGACPVLVEIAARGVASGLACASPADFGLVFPGTCIERAITCDNVGNTTETLLEVSLDEDADGRFELSPVTVPAELAPGDRVALNVEFCPQGSDPATGRVTVRSQGAFELEQTVELLGRGGGPRLSCTPSAVDFGRVGVGGLGRAAFTCFNDGFDPALLDLQLQAGGVFSVSVDSASIAPGVAEIIEVTVSPSAEGALADTLTITSNDAALPNLTVPLSAEGVVIGPCTLEVVPAELDFGMVNDRDLHAAPVIVRNAGSNDCLLGDPIVTMGSEHFGVRGGAARGETLAPGDSARFEVTFAPRLSAVLTGVVDVTTQNAGGGTISLPVRGQGGPAGLLTEPVALDFGAVPLGCAAPVTRTVTVRRIAGTPTSLNNVSVVSDVPGVFTLASEVSSTSLDFYETLTLEIGFAPSAEGAFSGQARLFFGLPSPVVVPLLGEARAVGDRTDSVSFDAPKLDLLFVIDDSGGNDAVQAGLASGVGAFLGRFEDRQADLHIGVITTDMEAPNRRGRLIGAPAVLTSATPDLEAALAERVAPGTEGAGIEQGLAASLAALTPPLVVQDNVDFRRADADLAIVYVSSEDDQSPGAVTTGALLETFRALARGQRLTIAALVGPPTGECDGPGGAAVSGERYATLVGRAEDGVLLSYCADPGDNLATLAEHLLGSDVALSGAPVLDQIEVRIEGVPVPAVDGQSRNWGYDLASNRVVFFDAEIATGDTVQVSYPQICVPGTCGDSSTDTGEYCDDGNDVDTDACVECRNAVCGDGITWAGTEDCDDGNLLDDDACLTTCAAARCGDGVVWAGVELCDDGNNVDGDGCPAACRFYQSSGVQPFAFQELVNGSTLTFSDDDDGRTSVDLPFVFEFAGVQTASLSVSVNGFASIQSIDPQTSFDNAEIPSAAAPNGLLAPWWDDLVVDSSIPGGAATSTATLGLAPNRQYVIEWRDLRSAQHNSFNHRRWTFQLVLEEGTNVIRFRYADTETRGRVPTAVTASAGLEDAAGTFGIEALGCSPTCQGPQRQGNRPDGFPEQSEVVLTP